MILSSDEEEEWAEWVPSGDDSSSDESSDDGGGQAARARKRKATAQGGTSKRSSYRGKAQVSSLKGLFWSFVIGSLSRMHITLGRRLLREGPVEGNYQHRRVQHAPG